MATSTLGEVSERTVLQQENTEHRDLGIPVRQRRWPKALGFLNPVVWLPLVVMLIVLGLLWQWGAHSMPYLLPQLGDVADSLSEETSYYIENALTTLAESLAGLAIAFIVAFVLAILTNEILTVRRAVMPVAVVLNVTPVVAIAPALVTAFGFGPTPKIVITAIICFFPLLINIAAGLRSVPEPVLQVYQTINASRLETLVHLRIPSALPFTFAALRIAFPLSIVGAVVAELTAAGSTKGLGTVISTASTMNQLPVVYASIFILAIMGVLLLAVITLIEKRALRNR